MNKRVQLRYYKKNPPNTKNVSRASRWGNPYKLLAHGGGFTLESSLKAYRYYIAIKLDKDPDFLKPLIGFDLGCFCDLDSPCHADILLEFLGEEE